MTSMEPSPRDVLSISIQIPYFTQLATQSTQGRVILAMFQLDSVICVYRASYTEGTSTIVT